MKIRIEFGGPISIGASERGQEDVYIGKAGSCERICTRISPASRAAGRIGCSVRIVNEGWRRVWIRVVGGIFSVLHGGEGKSGVGEEGENKKGARNGADASLRMHPGRKGPWVSVTDWRTSSSRIHLRVHVRADTPILSSVRGSYRGPVCGRAHGVYCGSAASSVFILARRRRGVSANSGGRYGKIWRPKRDAIPDIRVIVIEYRKLEEDSQTLNPSDIRSEKNILFSC